MWSLFVKIFIPNCTCTKLSSWFVLGPRASLVWQVDEMFPKEDIVWWCSMIYPRGGQGLRRMLCRVGCWRLTMTDEDVDRMNGVWVGNVPFESWRSSVWRLLEKTVLRRCVVTYILSKSWELGCWMCLSWRAPFSLFRIIPSFLLSSFTKDFVPPPNILHLGDLIVASLVNEGVLITLAKNGERIWLGVMC